MQRSETPPPPLPAARRHGLHKRDVTALLIFVVFAAIVLINFGVWK